MSIILLYHDVTLQGHEDESGFAGASAAHYKLTPADFRNHVSEIARTAVGTPAISPDAATWALTFDDGGVSAITDIASRLEEQNWRGWFFITTDRIGTPGFVTEDQVRELAARGHIIGSHSCSHPTRMSFCTREQLNYEWSSSKSRLEEILKQPVLSASVPGGHYTREVARAADQAGLKILFNSEPTERLHQVGNCLVFGRYTIYRGMSPSAAGRLLSSRVARWKQTAWWEIKKGAKACGGSAYLRFREIVHGLRYPARAEAR